MIEHQVNSNVLRIYQNMVNMIVGFPIWRRPSKFMNVTMLELCAFDCENFICGKVYYSTIRATTKSNLHFDRSFSNISEPAL
jgi:hypothetical protein